MMCRPDERDLEHAARLALAEARAQGLVGEPLVEAATDSVAALWAHVDRAAIRAAVVGCLQAQPPAGARGSG
jgi:hypothetical protein